MIVGPIIVTVSTLGFWLLLDGERNPLLFVLIGEVTAIGIACFIPVNSAAAVAELPPQRLSVGGAVNNTFRQGGSVLGIALGLGARLARNAERTRRRSRDAVGS